MTFEGGLVATNVEFAGTERFRILRRLGAGGMGIVYEALDGERNTRVALKTLRSLSADSLLRFKNEFHSLQDLQHRNLVSLFELICAEGQWFFTMELVEGVDFLQYVRTPIGAVSPNAPTLQAPAFDDTEIGAPPVGPHAVRGFDENRLRGCLGQLARGLIALHGAHKVHRDIKPSNILVSNENRVVLLDFGLVTSIRGNNEAESSEAKRVGTTAYMAPEQAAAKTVGPEADWYSFGTMLYECLTGRVPFMGPPLQVLMDKQRLEPRPPREIVSEVPQDLDALCVDLLRFDASSRPDGAEVIKRLGLREFTSQIRFPTISSSFTQTAPFVGREAQLQELRAAFDEAAQGRAVTVLVEGESGVGKSALVRRFTDDIVREGVLVLAGRCYERESVPYKALDGIIDALSRYLGRLPKNEAAALLPLRVSLLAQVFPVLRRVEAVAQSRMPFREVLDLQEQRSFVFSALREFLTRVAESHRVVLVIDDLQWADADSLALLGEVMKPPDAPPLLLISTMRPLSTDAHRTLEDRFAGPHRRIEVGPLPDADARELTLRLAREAGLGDEAADGIVREAQGHPLFIDELVRHTLHPEVGGRGAMALEDALWSRIRRLDAPVRNLLELVVVAGTPLPQDVAARAAEADPSSFSRWVAMLRVGNLVRTAGVRGIDAIEPFHDRVRVAVLAHLDAGEARARHARLALALEAHPNADPEALAVHWRAVGEPERAVRYAELAAEQAGEAFAFDRAVRLFRLCLELIAGDPLSERPFRIKLAEALSNAGLCFEAASLYRAVAKDSEPDESVDLMRRAADNLLRSGHIDLGLSTLHEAIGQFGVRVAESRRRALASLALQRLRLAVRGLKFEPRRQAEVPSQELARLDTLYAASTALGMIDHLRGADVQTRHLLTALELGEEKSAWRALAIEAVFLASRGGRHIKRAEALSRDVELAARRIADPLLLATAQLAIGASYFFSGRYLGAAVAFETAERLFGECRGREWERVTARFFVCFARLSMGQFEDGTRQAKRYVDEADRRNDIYARSLFTTHPTVWRLLCNDEPTEAERQLSTALDGWPRDAFYMAHFLEMVSRATIMIYSGDHAGALAWLRSRLPAFKRSMLASLPWLMAEYRRYFLPAAFAMGEHTSVAATLRRLAKLHVPLTDGYVALYRGALAHRAGDVGSGQRLLLEAAQLFESSDTPQISAACRYQLGRVIGGAEGARIQSEAHAWMKEHGVRNPERMVNLLAPEF